MNIRRAVMQDEKAILDLLEQQGYDCTLSFLRKKIKTLSDDPNSELLVYELDRRVVAFIAIDFLVQLGLKGDFARISYFAVDDQYRSKGIGKELEEYCEKISKERKCDRIELHCNEHRCDAHKFYYRQGYIESPKYLMKMLH